jgi:hypothetical protein
MIVESNYNIDEKVEVTLVNKDEKTDGTWYNAIVVEVKEEKNSTQNVYTLDILDKAELKKSNLTEKNIVRNCFLQNLLQNRR